MRSDIAKPLAEIKHNFDWNGGTVIVPHQPAIAVYFNDSGLVIRQQGADRDDSVVVIADKNVDLFLDKLTDACGIPSCKP
jgi:hypothetical protein